MADSQPSLGIVGAGKVGSTLARCLAQRGYIVRAVYSQVFSHARELAVRVDAEAVDSASAVIALADLTLLTVPDDAIESVAASITQPDLSGKALIHTSGAQDMHRLDSAALRGAMTGSLHPAFPFANVESAIAGLPGTTFAIEFSHTRLKIWLAEMVSALDGHLIEIPPGGKAIYHLALVLASNYTVTLYAAAEELLRTLGAEKSTADNALNALLAGTLENIRTQGIPAALTGPLVRNDKTTIAAHLDTLRGFDNILMDAYIALARLTFPLLTARGVATEGVESLLQQVKNHETDNS